jgi:hypothetical protein
MWELLGGDAGPRGREPLFGGRQPFRVISVDRNIDGRLAVFGLAEDDSVWHNEEKTPSVVNEETIPSVDDWTGWSPFGRRPGFLGRIGLLGRIVPARSSPGLRTLVVSRSPYLGNLAVYGIGRDDNTAWINEQTWPYHRWRGWRRFGDAPEGLREVVAPMTIHGLGNVAFALSVNDTVWINQLIDEHTRRWLGWQPLGEGELFSSLVIGRPDDLTIEAIGIAPDNTIWRNSTHVWELAQWSGWQPFGASGDQFHAVTTMRTGTFDGSESDVFALAPDDTIWRRAPGTTTWVRFGTPADRLTTITQICNSIFAVGLAGTAPDGTVWHADRLTVDQWGPLQPFGSGSDAFLKLAFAQGIDMRMHAFGLASDGTVWHESQTEPGTWPPP